MMEKHLALIKNKLVMSVAIGNDDFAAHVRDQYDYIIDVTNRERPTVGHSYYPETDSFIDNSNDVNLIPVDMNVSHMKMGAEDGFEPFNISKYSVSYKDGMVQIGCKKYSAVGLFDALHRVLIDKEAVDTIHCFRVAGGPGHGKFAITWSDARLLYEALSRVKF